MLGNNNSGVSYCSEMTKKDKLIVFDRKDLNGPVSSELLKSLDGYEDEPGNLCMIVEWRMILDFEPASAISHFLLV
jgi:hypothetical protein